MFDIEKEFEKNEELKKEDLDHLKEWLKKQPHLPEISDQHLILFLHSCYYRLEPTKVTIDTYFSIRTHAPEIFSNRSPFGKDLREAMKTLNMTKLPGKTPQGYDIFFSKLNRTEPELYVMADIIKLYHMHGDIWNMLHGTTAGYVIVFDMTGVSLGHVGRINMTVMKKNLSYLQDGIPLRLKGIHLMNVVSFIGIIMGMLNPFMKPHLQELFHYHQPNSDEVYKYIPKDMIPKESGGEGKSITVLHEEMITMLEDNADWFKNEETLRVNETKRPGRAKDSNDLFGVSGSFKKLSFD